MSKTTTKEVRNLSDAEISEKIENLRKELFDLRFKQATRQLAKTHRFKEARIELAQLLTVSNERTMALKEMVGTVVSDKMQKTVVVAVENRFPHPIYQKIISRTTRYKAHDADNHCKVGDRVRIKESPPMSAHKRWTVTDVLVKGMKSKEAAQ